MGAQLFDGKQMLLRLSGSQRTGPLGPDQAMGHRAANQHQRSETDRRPGYAGRGLGTALDILDARRAGMDRFDLALHLVTDSFPARASIPHREPGRPTSV